MKKLHLLIACIVIIFTFFNTNAQRGIGTNTPSSSAILELKSTTKGFLPPRLSITEIESIVSPAEGLTFYCTDCDVKGVFFFDGDSFIGIIDGLGLSAAIDDSRAALEQIGLEAGSGSSEITIAQLDAILPSLTDVNGSYESYYSTYIGSNEGLFGSSATHAKVQTAITFVTNVQDASIAALEQIGLEAGSGSSTITITQLNAILSSLTDVGVANLTAYNDYIARRGTLFTSTATQVEVQNMIAIVNSNINSNTVSGENGTVWMDRNLGATQVATSSTDHLSYGNLYQWGRYSDGHEVIAWTSSTGSDGAEQDDNKTNNSQTTRVGHSGFITGSSNWLSLPGWSNKSQNDLWQEVNGVNNPCPTGFRVPTDDELESERLAWDENNSAGAYASALKLPLAGRRGTQNGTLKDGSIRGRYWSSNSSSNSRGSVLNTNSSNANVSNYAKANAFSVRCIKHY